MDEMRAGVWMSVQQGKWKVPSWSFPQFLVQVQGRGGLVTGAHPVAMDLSSWVLGPECKASAEKKRASHAVRQEKEIY